MSPSSHFRRLASIVAASAIVLVGSPAFGTTAPDPPVPTEPATTASEPSVTSKPNTTTESTTEEPTSTDVSPTTDLVVTTTEEPDANSAPPTIGIDKTNTVGGEEEGDRGVIEPGATFGYRLVPSCFGSVQGCVDLTVVDIFPVGVLVDEETIPDDIEGFREVTWDYKTQTLTVIYESSLANPSGATGMAAGGTDDFTVDVTLPADTTFADATVITNEATVSAANALSPIPDPTSIEVDIPLVDASDGPVIFLTPDPTNTISIDKTNTADGEPAGDGGTVEPGDPFTYNFLATCSSIDVDCVDLTIVDTFPADVIVDASTLPPSIPGFRDVTYDAATQTLTVVYTQDLANPPDETGKIAGTSDSFIVSVTFPADTTLETGETILNEATISAGNVAESATDPSDVIVNIPRVVDVETRKSFSDPSAIAGDPSATTTMQLASDNLSSSSAEVTEMVIEDSTPATFEYLDFTSATVTQYPAGADQAQLFVCPQASAPCTEAEWVAGGTGTPPGPSTLAVPGAVPAGQVVGVRVVFTDTNGSFIEPVADGGTAAVDIYMDLRDTVRSTGQAIDTIPQTTVIDNVATSTVTDPVAAPSTATDDAGAQYQILPPTLSLDTSKSFFADGNGNYQTDGGEHAVIGENSGVSMIVNATNTSAFPIAEIVISEPSANPGAPPSEFEKFDPVSFALTFPEGAANANVVVTYDDGSFTTDDYSPPGPGTVVVGPGPPKVTSITVTFTGPDVDGDDEPDPTIIPDGSAGLNIHGNLNDLVDASDVAGAVDNCAGFTGSGGGVAGTTGTFVGNSCDPLPIEDRNPGTGGDKTASQTEIPPDQPVLFTMNTSNNGNLPLFDVVVADPPVGPDGDPPLTAAFVNLRFLDAFITNDNVAAAITLQVFIAGSGWITYPGPGPEALRLVTGVRATIAVLNPTESFTLNVEMQARFFADPEIAVPNCYGITASGGEFEAESFCSPPLTPTGLEESATLNKSISPETVPERIPGMDPADAEATVQLRVENTGTLTARYLQVTDNDADFWDAVDFVNLGAITPPAVGSFARADRIQIDAFVDGVWVNGTPTSIGSAALPAGVTPEEVRGLRFTFSDTSTINNGYVLTPCDSDAPPGECTGVVDFVIVPRLTLLSTGAPLPATLEDTATGEFDTLLSPGPTPIPPVIDNLTFVPGDPQLDVEKTPENATVQPGQLATFTLVTTNTGTANLPDVTVSDPLPDGILFDDTFADAGTGQPYTVTWSNLPAGYPAPPEAVFEPTPDPTDSTRVGLLRWTFPGWDMPPNAAVTIFFRYTLEPGVTAGQQIVNTMGASSPVDDLACTPTDVVVTDGAFGTGTYCTDPANVSVTAGANFASRKWVAGNPALGWFNESTGELVPVGGGGCLSLVANGRTYTTNPCIAIVNPGEDFHYVLRVQNAGTEDALQMTIVDTFPAPGDTGVAGADRGTQWSTAPTLAGPATYNGLPGAVIQYTTGAPCDGGLADWPCDDAAWSGFLSPGTTALRMIADFAPDPLPPGGTVDVYFSMATPVDVPRVADPTVAYNSIAHSEVTDIGNGSTRTLAPLEPLKVGVATLYGNLQVVKEIGENPAGLALDDLVFTFTYECTLTNGTVLPRGTVTATPTTPGVATGIPSGSTCEVWESGTNGAIATPTEAAPAVVVIEPSLDPDTPVVATVTATNDFPLGQVSVLKTVTGVEDPTFTAGPYRVTVDCRFNGSPLPSFPAEIDLVPGVPQTAINLPVGTVCAVTETDDRGATTVTYDPANGAGTAGEVTIPPEEDAADRVVTITITNDFPVGGLEVIKEIGENPGELPLDDVVFTFEYECTFEVDPPPSPTVSGQLTATANTPAVVEGLPAGTECEVWESGTNGGIPDATEDDPAVVTIEEGTILQPLTAVTVTNDFPLGHVDVVKEVPDDVNPAFTAGPYPATVDCTFAGTPLPDFPDEIELVPGEEQGYDVPVGTVCTVTETDDRGATTVSYDPPNADGTAAEVTVPPEDGSTLTITITNDFPVGGLQVVKEIGENPGELPLDDVEFTFQYECTFTVDPPPSPAVSGQLTATPTTPAVVEGLPAGTVCRVWESDTNGGIPSATEDDPAVVTIEQGTILHPLTSVTVTNDYPIGHAELVKAVDGGAQEEFTVGPYVITVTCRDLLGDIIPGFPDLVTLVPGVPIGTDLPVASTCTFTERNVPDGVTVTYDPSNADGTGGEVVIPSEEDVFVTVGITNTFAVGSLIIEKDVSGPGVPEFSGGPFVFDVTCDYLGNEDVYSTTVEVPGSTDGTPVESEPVTGLPVGAVCTVTETDSAGADIITPPQAVTIQANEQASVAFVGINNPFSAGTISVAKLVDGAGSGPFASASYTIAVECAVETDSGALVTLVDTSVTVPAGGDPVVVPGPGGAPALLPLGARCWGAEPASMGATRVTIDHRSYETGVEVVADAEGGVQELLITVTNTYDVARLTVTKAVVEEPDPNAVYTFGIACTITDTDGTVIGAPLLTGTTPFTLGGGELATFAVVIGSTCTVRETSSPTGATITYAETGGAGGASGDGIVTVGPDATVTVTNTFESEVSPQELPASA